MARPYRPSIVVALLLGTSAAMAQSKEQGSKLFPEIFDEWSPPTAPNQSAPKSAPATKPAAVTPNASATTKPAILPQPPNTPTPPVLLDIPSADQQSKSRKLMRELFAAQLADKSPIGRNKLLKSLLAESEKARDNPVDRYVLLIAVAQATCELVDLRTLSFAANQLAASYKVDGAAIKAEFACKMNFASPQTEVAIANLNSGFTLINELLAVDELDGAEKLIEVMRPAAAPSIPARVVLAKKSNAITERRARLAQIRQAEARLTTAPGDPSALLDVGRYYCFEKQKWETGLPMLAACAEPLVKAAATADLQAATAGTPGAAADAWWEAAEKEPSATPAQAQMRARAGLWYRSELRAGATGIRRSLIEKRLATLPPVAEPNLPATAARPVAEPPAPAAQATTLRMDNDGAEVTGKWKPAIFRQGKPRYIGANYLADNDGDKGSLSVTFRVPVAVAGRYEVRLSYVDGENRSNSVPVTISGHREGTAKVSIDQTKKPASTFFTPVGTYSFGAASVAVITVSNADTKGMVIVDAVELVPVGN